MAPNVTNYAEIQNDEIEALRSIYMDDFVEHNTKLGAWNVGNSHGISSPSPSLSFHHYYASCKQDGTRLIAGFDLL